MTVAIIVVAVAGLYILRTVAGPVNTIMALAMTTMCFLPKVLYGGTEADLTRSGIAGSEPRILTYTVAIAIIAILGVLAGRWLRVNLLLLPFVAFLVICYGFVWTQTGEVQAGMVHFLTAAAAWAAGAYAATCVDKDAKTGRTFVYWILGTVLLQLGISFLQFAGVPLFPTNAVTSELVGSRINGSFGHPTTLGKVLLLFMMVCLPFTRSAIRQTRLAAWAAILATFPMFIMSGGRANFFSAVVMILIWTLLLPRGRALGSKLAIPLVVGIAGFASAGVWVARFEEDPTGDTRQHFNDVAMALIPGNPVAGTGPNTYITTAGPTDALTAQGWPVHNSALLAAVEIGIVGAALLFLPLVIAFIVAWRQRREDSSVGDFARAYVASTPGIALVALTGWGMMSDTLPLWLFLAAFCFQQQLSSQLTPSSIWDESHRAKGIDTRWANRSARLSKSRGAVRPKGYYVSS
ncbi:O-antigen ligase family protein [Arthrobacter sp. efr-133-TYG-118]|uniref:O-antigen ligase family protein n=1 Tax=Arthrobacter sp. efr-133-TYG-118 TaxID=3040279 RepID=UPI00254D9DC5|nr:O-antigen ligase family protein [Arthrobacter sp. efr-133-TYG-118]